MDHPCQTHCKIVYSYNHLPSGQRWSQSTRSIYSTYWRCIKVLNPTINSLSSHKESHRHQNWPQWTGSQHLISYLSLQPIRALNSTPPFYSSFLQRQTFSHINKPFYLQQIQSTPSIPSILSSRSQLHQQIRHFQRSTSPGNDSIGSRVHSSNGIPHRRFRSVPSHSPRGNGRAVIP
jgi:hypothetical protein